MLTNDQSIPTVIKCIDDIICKKPNASIAWLADDHYLAEPILHAIAETPIQFISNRVEPYRSAKQASLNASFSDFCFNNQTENSLDHIFFRVAKERALVHYIINLAFLYLKPDGLLWLIGHKNEGIKTHIKKASARLGGPVSLSKGKNQLTTASITKSTIASERLDDQDYPKFRLIKHKDDQQFWSKPGIYGWNKLDPGSQFLGESLSAYLRRNEHSLSTKQVLDLGCGYGYLSVFLKQLGADYLVATDNCAAAIEATSRNLSGHPFCEVVASDAGDTIDKTFDLILCNPPFHQGFATSSHLHDKFIANTVRLMKPQGEAWYVVNQFLPLEKYCHEHALRYEEVSRNNSFKVSRITR